MPARPAASGRPLGITLLSGLCFLVAIWSFAAAAFPRFFYGGQIPAYPPLVLLHREFVHGESRFVGVGVPAAQQAVIAAAIGLVASALGVMLWKRVRLGPWAFLAVVWLGPIYYAAAFWRSPFGVIARQGLANLTPGMRALVWGNVGLAAVVLLLISAYVWRRRSRFQ